MKLSTKCRYGTRAVLEIAKSYEKGPVKRRDIVRNQNISDSYLENILIALKNGGIIDTIRGANGGYHLHKPPSEISVYEIVTILEGSIAPVECLEKPEICDRFKKCAARVVWSSMLEAKMGVLKKFSIADLLDMESVDYISDYVI